MDKLSKSWATALLLVSEGAHKYIERRSLFIAYPDNATDESVAITQNLIGGILDKVQNGLGYQPAWCKANNAVFAAVLANETGGYGYADLATIAQNAILQCRDIKSAVFVCQER